MTIFDYNYQNSFRFCFVMHKKTTNSRILVVVVKWRLVQLSHCENIHIFYLEKLISYYCLFFFKLRCGYSQTKGRRFEKKKKGCNVPFKLLKEMAKFIITVKNKSRVSLVKLVTIISVIISSNKGNHFWSRSSRRVASFGIYLWNFIATFGGVVTLGSLR